MTVAVQAPQDTGAIPIRTGALTVPLQIITAAGARHRAAVAEHRALPAWALLGIAAFAPAVIFLAVAQWHGWVSIAAISMTIVGTGCAFALDLVGTLQPPVTTPES